MPSAPFCDVGQLLKLFVCARLWSNILYTKDGVSGIQLSHANNAQRYRIKMEVVKVTGGFFK